LELQSGAKVVAQRMILKYEYIIHWCQRCLPTQLAVARRKWLYWSVCSM